MTLLPTDSWEVIARPDLPEYELNDRCPITGGTFNLENHHLWRRSFGKDFRDAWWVELKDGKVVPNRVNLSSAAHLEVTENRARIIYNEETELFFYVTDSRTVLLNPQPGPPMQLTTDGREEPWDAHAHDAEQECPKCKGRGKVAKPEPKDPDHEQAPPRPKTTWSVRVPKDEREDGYEVLEGLVEGATDQLKEANLLKSVNRGAIYYALIYVLVFFRQNFKPEAEKSA